MLEGYAPDNIPTLTAFFKFFKVMTIYQTTYDLDICKYSL